MSHSNLCECGNPLESGRRRRICKQCAWLDGRTCNERRVIRAMRVVSTATIPALALEMGVSERWAQRCVRRMVSQGRMVALPGIDDAADDPIIYRLADWQEESGALVAEDLAEAV